MKTNKKLGKKRKKEKIWGLTKPKDAGLLLGRACQELGLVWCQKMAGPVNAYNTDLC